jgi:hypothetical protein
LFLTLLSFAVILIPFMNCFLEFIGMFICGLLNLIEYP